MNAIEKALKTIELTNRILKCPECQKTAFNENGILKENGWNLLCQKHQKIRDEIVK